ncbi:MmgE/PrpD family protein [Streptomyces sp. NPDC017964]|uniref:MmgE/PrpD family protein n=1 Tax=Streptomyces sp. NPDC017964 TaxID=3365022 RepID=UPI00379D9DB1
MYTNKNHQPNVAELNPRHDMVGRIASYVDMARGERAAEPGRQAAFRAVFDLLGAAAAGIAEPGTVAIRSTVRNSMPAGTVSIWFSGASSSVIGAAWANSAAASALDLDDGHRLARGHPGAAVIPTAFAIATETDSTLEDIISAIVIGYEVGVTIGAARTTYGNTGTWSSYAVVATAAALRRTPHAVLEHALAIAGQSAPNQLFASAADLGANAPEGSAVKEGIPWSVVTGLVSLDLAEAGHTGPRNILDSPPHYRFPDELVLGSSPHICNTYFKLYACCRHVHAPLDGMLQLVDHHGINADEIDAINVETTSGALRIANRVHPTNLIDVQYSIPYCLALTAIVGPQALLPLTAEALTQDGATALARKVKLSLSPEFDARFPAETLARVTIACGDQRLTSDVVTPRGEATNPLSWADLEAKFKAATRMVATEAQQNQVLSAMNEARAGNLTALTASLAGMSLGSPGQVRGEVMYEV